VTSACDSIPEAFRPAGSGHVGRIVLALDHGTEIHWNGEIRVRRLDEACRKVSNGSRPTDRICANRLCDVLRFTTQFPRNDRDQKCVNPNRSMSRGGPRPGGVCRSELSVAGSRLGRSNGTKRVFSGWIVKPYFSSRLGGTASVFGTK